jgi:arsenite-transporting ATPase
MRIILFTGKGGVGKTSISAATAIRSAQLGNRTIIVSTDPAHSLGDSFDQSIGPEPVQLAPNLWAQEIDLLHQMEQNWGTVQQYLATLFAWRGMDGMMAEEASILPGMEELASLLQIGSLADSDEYDVIVVDMAPTGATLQLLAFPEMASWYIEKIFPFERTAMKIARPIMRSMSDIPMPEDDFFNAVESLVRDLSQLEALLTDRDTSSVRLVVNPEKMVIREAQRAFTYLNLYNLPVDAVISNRHLPIEVQDPYFDLWKQRQAHYAQVIEDSFSPLPIFSVPLLDSEVVGYDMLAKMGEVIYGEDDPTQIYYRGQAQQLIKNGDDYILLLPLPLVKKGDINLHRGSYDELIVRIGGWKRHISLPSTLAGKDVAGARYREDHLEIRFH